MMRKFREKKIISGNILEVDVFSVFKEAKKGGRKKKFKPSSEVQKKLNEKNSKKNAIRLANTNFGIGDIEIGLDFSPEYHPSDEKECKNDVNNYLRRVKYHRKKQGLSELKYIAVIEKGEKKGRFHAHIIMNGGINRDVLEELWGKGRANSKRLQPDRYGLSKITSYITKPETAGFFETPSKWWASTNLKKPTTPPTNDNRYHRKDVEEMKNNPENRELFERLYPGYFFNDCHTFYNEVNGGIYLSINMIRKEKTYPKGGIKNAENDLAGVHEKP